MFESQLNSQIVHDVEMKILNELFQLFFFHFKKKSFKVEGKHLSHSTIIDGNSNKIRISRKNFLALQRLSTFFTDFKLTHNKVNLIKNGSLI
jgi:hypothetical protein